MATRKDQIPSTDAIVSELLKVLYDHKMHPEEIRPTAHTGELVNAASELLEIELEPEVDRVLMRRIDVALRQLERCGLAVCLDMENWQITDEGMRQVQ